MNSVSQRWVTVFSGPVWQAFAVQSRLEGAGFTTFVPDRNLRTLDPYATGGDAFSLEVRVPADSAEAALEVVEADAALAPGSETSAYEDPRSIASLGRRMRWSTVLLPPLGLIFGFAYLQRIRRDGVRPPDHRFNLITLAVAMALTAIELFIFGSWIAPQLDWAG